MTQLTIGSTGKDYFFTENESLLAELKETYPMLEFVPTLSLSQWPHLRNLHLLNVKCALREGLTYDSVTVQDALLDGLYEFLDAVVEDMHHNGITKATVYVDRIETGTSVNSTALKSEVYGNLRAVFVK